MKTLKYTIVGEINSYKVRKLANFLAKNDRAGVTIDITLSSGGGHTDSGVAMYELLKTCKAAVIMTAYGIVGSIAVLIFMAAKKRYMTPGCRLYLHQGTIGSGYPEPIFSNREQAEEHVRCHRWYCEQISEVSGADLSAVAKFCAGDHFFSARESVKLGFATKIKFYNK